MNSEATGPYLSRHALAVLGASALLVLGGLLAAFLAGELPPSSYYPAALLAAYEFMAALFVASLAFNAFLSSGSARVLWVGNAFFLFALFNSFALTTTGLNSHHAYFLLALLCAALSMLYAYRLRAEVPWERRTGMLVRMLIAALGLSLVAYFGVLEDGGLLPAFVKGAGHTAAFSSTATLTAVLLLLVSVLFLRAHARNQSAILLAIAVGAIWLAGAAVAYSLAVWHPDKWHWVGRFFELAGSIAVFGGALAAYAQNNRTPAQLPKPERR